MAKRWMAVLAVLLLAPAAAQAQDAPPPGCRWQNGDGGVILACKDSKGYWRRSGDDEIVGYDPPKARPKPKPAVVPAPQPAVAPKPVVAAAPPPQSVQAPEPAPPPQAEPPAPAPVQPPAAAPTPPEPPPGPPLTPVERLFHWLAQALRNLFAWIGGLF